MAAIVSGKLVKTDPRFVPMSGDAQRWIGAQGATRSLDLSSPTSRPLQARSAFLPVAGPGAPVGHASRSDGRDPEALRAAQGFEQVFVQYILKSMRAAVPDGGLLGNSFASNIYQGMFDEYLSGQASQSNGLGIADMLYQEIVRERQGRVAYQAMTAADTDKASSSTQQSATNIEASGASRSSR